MLRALVLHVFVHAAKNNPFESHPFHPLCVDESVFVLTTLSNGMNYGRARRLLTLLCDQPKTALDFIHIQLGKVFVRLFCWEIYTMK